MNNQKIIITAFFSVLLVLLVVFIYLGLTREQKEKLERRYRQNCGNMCIDGVYPDDNGDNQ